MDNMRIMRKNCNTPVVMTLEWGVSVFCFLNYPIHTLVNVEVVQN